MSRNGMIPGQAPYSEREKKALAKLLSDACSAEEECPYSELEEYASEYDRGVFEGSLPEDEDEVFES